MGWMTSERAARVTPCVKLAVHRASHRVLQLPATRTAVIALAVPAAIELTPEVAVGKRV